MRHVALDQVIKHEVPFEVCDSKNIVMIFSVNHAKFLSSARKTVSWKKNVPDLSDTFINHLEFDGV